MLSSVLAISTALNCEQGKTLEQVFEAAREASTNTVQHRNFYAQRSACSSIKQIMLDLEVEFGKQGAQPTEGYLVLQKQKEIFHSCEENERFLETLYINTPEYKAVVECRKLEEMYGR